MSQELISNKRKIFVAPNIQNKKVKNEEPQLAVPWALENNESKNEMKKWSRKSVDPDFNPQKDSIIFQQMEVKVYSKKSTIFPGKFHFFYLFLIII